MNGSNSLEELDARPLELCPVCMAKACELCIQSAVLPGLVTLLLAGCGREEVRLAPVVNAIAVSDGFRHMPIPSRPLVLYVDLPIADSLAHPDSIAWLIVAQDRWHFLQQRPPDGPVQICPDDGWMDAIRAAQAYTDRQQSKGQR